MKYYLHLFVMIIATSCNKDYNTIGINLITNKPFNTSVKEVPVFVKMKKIPPYVVNQIQTFQLGTYQDNICLLYTSPSPRDGLLSRMPSSA